jgi:hypothetical protein
MTDDEIRERLLLLRRQAAELVRRENDQKIAAALEKILKSYEGRISREWDKQLSRAIDSLRFLIESARGRLQ